MALVYIGFSIVLLCWAIFGIYWLVSSFFVKRSVTKRNPWSIIWGVIIRVIILVLFIIAIKIYNIGTQNYVSFLTLLFYSSFSFPVIGSVLTVVGLIGAIWARIYLGRNWSGYVTYKEDQELVTSGPYRFVRHPIYSSMLLMFIGTILYYGFWFFVVIFLIATIAFMRRTKKEEEIMIKLFGNRYTDYMKRTKKLIPWIY
jgi:protein-S-isoprenylcysteine O-methyltransferase Ste14